MTTVCFAGRRFRAERQSFRARRKLGKFGGPKSVAGWSVRGSVCGRVGLQAGWSAAGLVCRRVGLAGGPTTRRKRFQSEMQYS
jgi:hypothetical protein